MIETLLITFREGLEAFLVVAIMLAYLTKTGRTNLVKPVYAGIAAALLISATTGWHVAEMAEDPLWEGTLALAAGILVASFTIYIMRTAKTIRQDIGNSLERSAQKEGMAAQIGVFVFTVLMIAREGMETALMLGAITAQQDAVQMWMGGMAGLLAVAFIAYLWSSQSNKINLRLFLQVTGIFLVLFSIDLFVYGMHELAEMNALPLIGPEANHWLYEATEMPKLVKNMITYSLLAVPTLWLAVSYIKDRFNRQPMAAE